MASSLAELRMEMAGEISQHELNAQREMDAAATLRRVLGRLDAAMSREAAAAPSAIEPPPRAAEHQAARRNVRGAIMQMMAQGKPASFDVISGGLNEAIGEVQDFALRRSLETLIRDGNIATLGQEYMLPAVRDEMIRERQEEAIPAAADG